MGDGKSHFASLPVDHVKQRLVAFRRRVPDLTVDQQQTIRKLRVRSMTIRYVGSTFDVLDHFGKSWVSAWLKWEDQLFADPKSSLLGQKEKQRAKHFSGISVPLFPLIAHRRIV